MSVIAATLARLDAATDGQLLGRFVQARDADAFAALVRRLGPTVLAVCRRACPDSHLAEDAFQAAFLVLAKKADSVKPRERVAVWLHGVAFRTASKARAMLASRRRRETGSPALPDPPAADSVASDEDELRKLDAAIAGLPEHLRAAVVLCELEGRSRKDAAKALGIAEGTLSSRLADARKRLGARLRPTVAAVVTAALAATTAEAAVSGSTSETVLSLARGVMSMMLLNKLKVPAVLLLAVAVFASAAVVSVPPPVMSAAPVPKSQEKTTPFVEWKYVEQSNDLTSPLMCGAAVVVGTGDGVLRAFRARDGKELWEHKHGKRIFHTPSTDGERVYFCSANGVTAVSADKGEEVWRFDVKQGDGPVWADAKLGLVFAAGENGQAYALDAKSGEEKWKADFVKDAPPDRPGFAGKDIRLDKTLARPNAFASDGELLVLSVFDQSRVVAFDPQTGKQKWVFQADGYIWAAAGFGKAHVFVSSYDKCVHCLDKQTGKPVWKYETGKWSSSAPVVDGASVYVPSDDGVLHAVAQKDGKKLWTFEADLDANGKRTAIYSNPILRRGTVHFATGEGQCYAVNATDGTLRWKLRPSEHSELYCSPAFDGTRFFVTSRPNREGGGEAALLALGLK